MKNGVQGLIANIVGAVTCFVILCLMDMLFNDDVSFKTNAVIAVVIVAVQAFVGFLRATK